jgi:hypothetical protein
MTIIWVFVVLLTFFVPFWMKIVLFGLNYFLPDFLPYVDEVMQLYSIFNSSFIVKGIKIGNGIRRL